MLIKLYKIMQEWPLKSALDPDVYGPPESAITKELVERGIKGFMTVDEVRTFPLSFFLPSINLPRIKLSKFGNMNAGIRTEETIHHRLP